MGSLFWILSLRGNDGGGNLCIFRSALKVKALDFKTAFETALKKFEKLAA